MLDDPAEMAKGRDPQLERAIEEMKKPSKPSPRGQRSRLIRTGLGYSGSACVTRSPVCCDAWLKQPSELGVLALPANAKRMRALVDTIYLNCLT